MNIALILAVGMLFSCGKDDECPMVDPPICMEDYTGPLEVIWSVLLRPDTTIAQTIYPVIYDDHILFGQLSLNELNIIFSHHPETGVRQWEWNDLPYVGEVIQFNNATQGYDDKFYLNYRNHKILIDVDNGTTDWISFRNSSDTKISVGVEHHYYVQYYGTGAIWDSELFRANKQVEPGWESVYRRNGNSTIGRIGFDIPVEWISPTNDTIVIFGSSRINVPTESDLVAYNITQDKIEWEIANITEISEISRHPPLVVGNLAYITNVWTVSCVDLLTGIELWETENLGAGVVFCAPVIGDSKIFFNGSSGKIRAIDLNNGAVLWSRDDEDGENSPNMAYYKGGVYFGSEAVSGDYLWGLDADTGEVFYKEESPNKNCKSSTGFAFGLAIDQESGRMYTTDGAFAMCIQLEPR